ncbi:class III aminotransferase [Xylariaceae sp. FL0255]|nr:class III aminotransferase [Xylariaceae sp. FL0255]
MKDDTRDSLDPIQAAYTKAEAQYIAANPLSHAAYAEAGRNMPGGNTRSVLYWAPFPVSVTSAEGYALHDADSHHYVDLLGEFSAGLYGHSDAVLQEAAVETLRQGLSFGAPHAAEARLAGLIRSRFPNSIELLRFTNSGTEATLMALAAAKAFTRRIRGKVLVFEAAYHGGVFYFPQGCSGAWSNGERKAGEGMEKNLERLVAVNAPHEYLVATYNDVASVDSLLDGKDGEDGVAAILIEPMLGSGGGIRATPEFLTHLRRRASELGALLIFDEVVTSRMYSGGGIQTELGVVPDLTTLGKYIGGGMSFGAFGGRADVMSLFDPRSPEAIRHAGTFNNNVLTMNVGATGLERVFTPAKARQLHVLGDQVRDRINAIGSTLKVLGCGSILTFHVTAVAAADVRSPDDLAGEDPRLVDLFHLEMLHEGFYLARRGHVSLSLPLLEPKGRRELDRFVGAVEGFVQRFQGLLGLSSSPMRKG